MAVGVFIFIFMSALIGGLADFYAQDVPKVFANVKDTALQEEFARANTAAIAPRTPHSSRN